MPGIVGPPSPVRADVSVCLATGELAAAALESLRELGASPTVADHGTYLKIIDRPRICIDLDDVSARIGRFVSMAEFLGWMSTYVGAVEIGERTFAVSAGFPDRAAPVQM